MERLPRPLGSGEPVEHLHAPASSPIHADLLRGVDERRRQTRLVGRDTRVGGGRDADEHRTDADDMITMPGSRSDTNEPPTGIRGVHPGIIPADTHIYKLLSV